MGDADRAARTTDRWEKVLDDPDQFRALDPVQTAKLARALTDITLAAASAELVPSWGFCTNFDCSCWLPDLAPCGEFMEGEHYFDRCGRCGLPHRNVTVSRWRIRLARRCLGLSRA